MDANDNQELVGAMEHKNFSLEDDFFGQAAVKSINDIFSFLVDYFWEDDEMVDATEYCFHIIQGVRVEANDDAGILDHILVHCTKYYKGLFKRYDYVVVEVDYNDGTTGMQVAQVVCILDMKHGMLGQSKYLFIVQYMQEDTNSRNHSLFKTLKWEEALIRNNKNLVVREYRVGIIDFESIVDIAEVIPFFSYIDYYYYIATSTG